MTKIFINLLPALAAVKAPLQSALYLNWLMPLIGVFHLLYTKKIQITILSIIIIVLLNYFISPWAIIVPDTLRYIYLIGCFLFANFLASQPREYYRELVNNYFVLLSLFIFILELFTTMPQFKNTSIFVSYIELRVLLGMMGESNFSGLLYGTLLLISISFAETTKKKCLYGLIYTILIFYSLSRGAFVGLAIAITYLFIKNMFKNYPGFNSLFYWVTLLLIAAMPLIFPVLESALQEETWLYLNGQSTNRLELWSAFSKLGIKYFFGGVGYFNGQEMIKISNYYPIAKQAHSLPMTLFAEFGLLGYMGLSTIFFVIARIAKQKCRGEIVLFLLVSSCFLNTLSVLPFHLCIGFILSPNHKST